MNKLSLSGFIVVCNFSKQEGFSIYNICEIQQSESVFSQIYGHLDQSTWLGGIWKSPGNISIKLLENQPDNFVREDFLSFHYSHIRQNSTAPLWPCFQPINMAWRNLIEGHPRNISTKLFENQPDTFGVEDFLSFHLSHIRQSTSAPWRQCFLTNQHGLKESDKRIIQGTFLQNDLKIGHPVWEKNIFKVFSLCMVPKNLKEFLWGH